MPAVGVTDISNFYGLIKAYKAAFSAGVQPIFGVDLRVIEEALSQGLGALVLVPEIALTPQLVGRFQARFGETVALLHSGLSVRQVEKLVSRAKSGEAAEATKPEKRQDPNVAAAEKRLMGVLGARVNIVRSTRGAGRIEILFKTDEELDRLFQHLVDDEQVAATEVQ